ncbi:MAG: GGDEF domain-containing protein [Clostridiales bacterium]
MSKNKVNQFNSEFYPPTLITASIFLSTTITVFLYMFLSIFIDFSEILSKKIFISFLIIFAILITFVFFLFGILYNERIKSKYYTTELKNFKDFTDELHTVSSETEVYELLYEFISKIPGIDLTRLFYRSDFSEEDAEWQIMSSDNSQLCNMSAKTCPLIQYNRECIVDNIRSKAICRYQSSEFKTGSYVCLMVINSGFRQCTIQLYSKTEYFFDAIVISKIKSYIEISKVIINSGRTVQMLNEKVSTDKLTKLYNRTFVDTFLDKQLDLSRFSYKQVSLIVGDIDFFKSINDTYGHAAGDYILVKFSQELVKSTRKSDIVARYGGDEFLIVLPDTDTDTAIQVSERIVQNIRNLKIPTFDGQEIKQITCSLGLSTFPGYCDSKESLMKTADIALYKSKQNGRNCSSVFTPV